MHSLFLLLFMLVAAPLAGFVPWRPWPACWWWCAGTWPRRREFVRLLRDWRTAAGPAGHLRPDPGAGPDHRHHRRLRARRRAGAVPPEGRRRRRVKPAFDPRQGGAAMVEAICGDRPQGRLALSTRTEHGMTTRNFDALFTPGAIALIGASNRPELRGRGARAQSSGGGFNGPIMAVNPHETAIGSALELPQRRRPAGGPGPGGARDAAGDHSRPDRRAGRARAAGRRWWSPPASARAAAPRARPCAPHMLEAARPHLLRIVGPNCLGFMSPGAGSTPASPISRRTPGDIAFLSQSGALVTAVLDWAGARGDRLFPHRLPGRHERRRFRRPAGLPGPGRRRPAPSCSMSRASRRRASS